MKYTTSLFESPSARPPEAGLIPAGDRLPYPADEGLS
jgi:hypothetical protein